MDVEKKGGINGEEEILCGDPGEEIREIMQLRGS